MTHNPFDHERDVELGAVLRAHLEGADPAAFAARVRRALATEIPLGPFDVLGGWLRPGVAAAALIALAAGWWITSGTRAEVASGTPVEIFASGGATDVMLATASGAR